MRLRITAALAALGLASCGYVDVNFGGDEGNASANQAGNAAAAASGNQAQAADAGVTSSRSLQQLQGGGASGGKDPMAGGAINPALLVGSWGDNGDCSSPTEIFADGTFRAPNGGEGNWRLEGNTLIATGPGGAATMQITSVTATELIGTDAQGAPGRSIRC